MGVDQTDHVDLRKNLQAVGEEAVDLLGPDSMFELARIIDTGGVNHGLHLLQDEIDGLYRACRLFGQDDSEIACFLPGPRKRGLAPVPNGSAGGQNDDGQ